MATAPFRILAVCTANQCRSPLVEFSLRRRLDALGLAWVVRSAGTRAVPGLPPHPFTTRLLRERGSADAGWTSQRVDDALVQSADLILTASLEHRNQVVHAWPEAAKRSFTVLQLAAYCSTRPPGLAGAGPDRPSLTAWVAEARRILPATELGQDLPDPVGRSFRTFRRLDAMVEEAVDLVLPLQGR